MYLKKSSIALIYIAALFCLTSKAEIYSGLSGFSAAFQYDLEVAQDAVNQTKSIEPLVALQKRYTNTFEKAELEVQIGLAFNQRTGVVNPSNAVVHLTTALEYDFLPEKTRLQILLWRGSSREMLSRRGDSPEQLANKNAALKDYLRGLLACTYYDIPSGWPEILDPKDTIYMSSFDPENLVRANDYHEYRRQLDFQRFLIMQRYNFITGAKSLRQGKSDREIIEVLETISPDSSRYGKVIDMLNSQAKQPWL